MLNNDPIPDILLRDRKGIKKGNEINFLCLVHDDHNPSANYNTEKKAWNCFACGDNGGFVDLQKKLGIYEVPQHKGKTWEIRDISNKLITTKYRSDNGTGKKYWYEPKGIKTKELPLYNTEKIPTYSKDEPLFIVEGEKCTESLIKHGFQALGTITGAGSIPNREVFEPVLDFSEIFLLPDNDNAGYQHMTSIKQYLPQSNIYKWIDKPDKYDIADFIAESNNPDNDIKNLVSEFYSFLYSPKTEVPGSVPFKEPGTSVSSDYKKDILTAKDLFDYEPPEITWVWDNMLSTGGTALLVSRAKVGKTQLILGLSLAISKGIDFLGRGTNKGKVLILLFEGHIRDIRKRLFDMGLEPNNDNVIVRIAPTPRLKEFETVHEWFEKTVNDIKPSLVIIDTLFTMFPGSLQLVNDYQIISLLMPLENVARKTDTCILVTHHQKKSLTNDIDSVLGSTGLSASVDHIIGYQNTKSDNRELKTLGIREGEGIHEPIVVNLNNNGFPLNAGNSSDYKYQKIWNLIVDVFQNSDDERLQAKDLRDDVPANKQDLNKTINRYVNNGDLIKEQEGNFVFYKLRDISESPWGS